MKVRTLLPLIVALATHLACAENPVGDLLVKARELDGLERIPRASFFTGEGDTELVFLEFRADEEGSFAEMLSLKRDGSWIGSRLGLGPAGELLSWKFVRDTAFVEPRPEQIAEGTVEGKTLTFTKGGKPMGSCEIPEGGVVDTGTAFLVLPAYYDLLPEELHFSIVADDAIHPGFKMTHSKLDEEREAVVLVGPGGLHAEFNVSTVEATRGKILSLNVGGEVSIQIDAEKGEKLL